jgi:CHAT domain-containing protein
MDTRGETSCLLSTSQRRGVAHPALPRLKHSKRGYLLLFFLGLIFVSIGGTAPGMRHSDCTGGISVLAVRARLTRSLGGIRPSDGRLAGCFAYTEVGRRGKASSEELRRFASILKETSDKSSPSESLGNQALIHLAIGHLDNALVALKKGLSLDSRNPVLWNDLAVVYITRAARDNQAAESDWAMALQATEEALSLRNDFVEAIFNKAVILTKLHLDSSAEQAWQAYLALDKESKWAIEARHQLARIRGLSLPRQWELDKRQLGVEDVVQIRLLVKKFPSFARLYAEDELLGRWSAAVLRGDLQQADETLHLVRELAEALFAANDDRLLIDSVEGISGSRVSAERLSAMARGLSFYAQALDAEKHDRYADAQSKFSEAEEILVELNSPFSLWAKFNQAFCLHFQGDDLSSSEILSDIRRIAQDRGYHSLLGRVLWIQGLIDLVSYNLPRAVARHQLALQVFAALGETPHEGFIHSLLALEFSQLGERGLAWRHRYMALASLRQHQDTRRIYSVLWEAAQAALAADQPYAALSFLSEIEASGSLDPLPGLHAEVLLRRARILVQVGRRVAALQSMHSARAWLALVEDSRFSERISADLLVSEGQINLRSRPRLAATSLEKASKTYRNLGYQVEAAEVARIQAKAYAEIGLYEQADTSLREALEIYEATRASLKTETSKITYFEQIQKVSDQMIALQQGPRNNPLAAMQYAEQSRMRSLLDALGQRSDTSVGSLKKAIADLERELPSGVAVVEYSVLEDHLIVWVITKEGMYAATIPVAADILSEYVDEFRREIQDESLNLRAAARLYDYLIRPLEAQIGDQRQVVIVPDKHLKLVAFSALYDQQRRGFFVQRHDIVMAPSISLYIASLHRYLSRGRKMQTVVTIADSSFDRTAFPYLGRLPDAEAEAERLGDLFRNAVVLTDGEATKARFLRALVNYRPDVVHIATHALSSEHIPDASSLILTPDGDDGIMGANELRGIQLENTWLVTLAVCSSGGNVGNLEEGVMNLARPFMAAGVPSVMISMWAIRDGGSAVFLRSFYQRLAMERSVVKALGDTQRNMIATSGLATRSTWAAFSLYGGN